MQTQTMIHYNSLTHLFCLSVYQDYTSIYCKDIFQSEKDKAVLHIAAGDKINIYFFLIQHYRLGINIYEGFNFTVLLLVLIVAVKLYIRTVNFRIIQPTINI